LSHPLRERGDSGGRDFLIIPGHGLDLIAVRVVNSPDEAALLGLTGYDDGTTLSPFEDEGARVEPEAGLLLLGPVTAVAVLGEDRTNLSLEELDLGERGLGLGRRGKGSDEQRDSSGQGHLFRTPHWRRGFPVRGT
jgi:hypothetical protein